MSTRTLAVKGVATATEPMVEDLDISVTVAQFIAAQDVKPSSRQTYRRMIKPFISWWRGIGFTAPSRDHILAYKRHMEARKLSPLTLSAYMVVVRKFFEWAEATKRYPNVAKGVKGAKRVRGFRKDSLTLPQLRELLNAADRSSLQGLRDHAILTLLVHTGLRTIEITRADIGDLRQQAGEAILWVQGKGRDAKDEFVIVTEDALKPIREYLAVRGGVDESEPLFASESNRNQKQRLSPRSVSRLVKDHLKAIGINTSRLTAHSLRHSAITVALQAGASLQEAQSLGRHASITTTMAYAHNLDRIAKAPEKKIAALLRSDPKGTND